MDSDRIIFLRGEKTILRPVSIETDATAITIWENDPKLRELATDLMLPIPEMGMRANLEKSSSLVERSPRGFLLVIEQVEIGPPIGIVALTQIDWVHRTASAGWYIGPSELRKIGLGSDAIGTFLRYAFGSLGLRVIQSTANKDNEVGIATLLKQGYKKVGRLPRWTLHDGKFRDKLIFVLTKEAFDKKHRKKG